MSDKKRDIDFFRGNVGNEVEKAPENHDDDFTYSDFKFKKKDANKSIISTAKIKEEQLRKARFLREKREKELLMQQELEKENYRKKQAYLDQDPNIILGARKPLKPLNEQAQSFSKQNTFHDSKKNKPKNTRKKIRIAAVILSIILAVLIVLVATLFVIKKTAKPIDIVVIGVDQRTGQKDTEIRADALMNITVGPKDNEILIASIPRDTYTYIPCEGYNDKITHAYSYGAVNWRDKGGGIGCTVESVNDLLKTKTDKYAKINFDQMVEIVDAIGGIDMEATATFCEQDSQGRADEEHKICFEKGKTYHMNGEQALAYSRHRKTDDDIQRGLRQQEVFNKMIAKIKKQNIFMWPSMFAKLSSIVDTNLTTIEMLQIALVYLTNGETSNYKFDWQGFYSRGVAYVKLGEASLEEYQNKIKEIQ